MSTHASPAARVVLTGLLLLVAPAPALGAEQGQVVSSDWVELPQGQSPTPGALPPVVVGRGGLRDGTAQHRRASLSFHYAVPWGTWWAGFSHGPGLRFSIPLASQGFLPGINDSFQLELGVDLRLAFTDFRPNGTGLLFPAEGRWTFHFAPGFALYAKVSFGLNLFMGYHPGLGTGTFPTFHASVYGGMDLELFSMVSLRVEAGNADAKVAFAVEL